MPPLGQDGGHQQSEFTRVRNIDLVQGHEARAIGQPARLRVTEAEPSDGAPAPKPRKLTDASLKADRLRTFRTKDPTLDTAADALDLEIVD